MKYLFRYGITAMLSCAISASTVGSNSSRLDDPEKLEIASRRLITFLKNKSSKANVEAKKSDDDAVSPRVINGADAQAGLYPWYVSIWGNCGGSLISPEYVLTAAHCLPNWSPAMGGSVNVGLLCGQWDDENNSNCGQKMEIIEIEDVVLHPGFPSFIFENPPDPDDTIDWVDDIALIKLRNKSTIKPVQMDLDGVSQIYLPDTEVWVAGFGVFKDEPVPGGDDIFSGRIPDILQHADLYTVDEHSCAEFWDSMALDQPVHFKIDERYLCATSPNLKTACWGDSGGPLYDRDNEVLVGNVVSGTITDPDGPIFTCTTDGPNIYSRVSQYRTWITHNVCKNHSSPKPNFCDDLEPTASPTTLQCSKDEIDVKLEVLTGSSISIWAIDYGTSPDDLEMDDGVAASDDEMLPNSFYTYHYCLPSCDDYLFIFLSEESGDGFYALHVDDEEISSGSATMPFEGFPDEFHSIYDSYSVALAPIISDGDCPTPAPTVSPTPAPPCLPGDITFKLDLHTDNHGSEIGWNITDLSTNTVVTTYGAGQGDIPYLESNTFYSFKECLPCSGYMFAIYDTYGDGLSEDGKFEVTVDDKVIKTLESSPFTTESVNFRGGPQCPLPPFRIISKGRTNMCLQPEKNRLDSRIVVKKCKDKSLLQRWTVDWMGQHHSAKAPRRCMKVKDDQLVFQRCSKNGLKSDLSTNFIVNALHERISWMNDARKVFSLLQGNSKQVKLANFWNPDEESVEKLDRQAWYIEYDY